MGNHLDERESGETSRPSHIAELRPEHPGADHALPGFRAVRRSDPDPGRPVADAVRTSSHGTVLLDHWGLADDRRSGATLVPTSVCRTATGAVPLPTVDQSMQHDPGRLTAMLPPFAAARGDANGVVMVADTMGFRQLYHSDPVSTGTPSLSTSALVAARDTSDGFDETALAVQSLLGWQLEQRTLFRGVEKLRPGAWARIDEAGVHVTVPEARTEGPITLERASAEAADLLRRSLNALLDDHPDAVIQLTGGQDSRLLLSAIPRARRRGLRAMTLGDGTSGDVVVARQLAERDGLQHEIHDLVGLESVTPQEAWELCRTASVHLDASSDPVAHAALTFAERKFEQGVRISGLGGEVGRGFYYVGKVHDKAYDRSDAARLARWRMFANEAAESSLFDPEFDAWRHDEAVDAVHRALTGGGTEWFRATDDLYLRHRMQRWAGVTDTAVGSQRTVINPMLDDDFIRLASRLAPQDKVGSRLLATVQMILDPKLGAMPLDGRPAPKDYARPTTWTRTASMAGTGRRLVRKAGQRLRGRTKPPAGGAVLAAKVAHHWRAEPEVLRPLSGTGFIRDEWLEQVLTGTRQPTPSSVAFLTNVVVAAEALGAHAIRP